ncbi:MULTISPECIES: DUF1129 domain-containing protein [unclassified Streptococcus]|uniref:DUF1129 domain-containing protein n=1 Tax=unclassified Streptococcus TaxID=2608887 RepID=UPI00107196DB|nr:MULTISPECIES: DUF1129 family protein [unclassified Streptococcus]MBF0787927.1 DUF1129 family protein [Streptococcus sp. 19428wC2_LYSM12]MCQ9211291.1 DUF1129 family protein [Streptococcus sp. B01]MCQ9214603.1 DUF1129 family protein [Streptococcus sp. O1]TFV05047.1 DUF1129 family protein [Streptococcus sp. LYSM12]
MSFTTIKDLTKKNQEFIHIATNQLIKTGKTDVEIKELLEEILPVILENQKAGVTARSIYGAPSDWAASKTTKTKETEQPLNENPWLMWLDSSLLLLAIIGVVNGAMNSFGAGVNYGLITMLLIGFGIGAGMYMMYHFVYREQAKTGKRPSLVKALGFLVLATLAWSLVFFLAALIPSSINPSVSPFFAIIIGVVAFGIRYLIKKKYNIRNAMQPMS